MQVDVHTVGAAEGPGVLVLVGGLEQILETQALQDPDRRLPVPGRNEEVDVSVGTELVVVKQPLGAGPFEQDAVDCSCRKCCGDHARGAVKKKGSEGG